MLQYVCAGFQVVPGLKIWPVKTSGTGCNHILKILYSLCVKCFNWLLSDLTDTAFGDLLCKITLSEVEVEKRIKCVCVSDGEDVVLPWRAGGWRQDSGAALVSGADWLGPLDQLFPFLIFPAPTWQEIQNCIEKISIQSFTTYFVWN